LRAADHVGEVIGFDRDGAAAARAQALGLVDRVAADAASAARDADLIVLAVPVAAIGEVAAAIAGALGPDAVVTDVGSLKAPVVAAAEAAFAAVGRAARFIGGHPMAGSERHGPDAADVSLFRGRVALLTPTTITAADVRAAAHALWTAVGAQVVELDPAAHDAAVAAVSHLPHALAFTLARAVEAEPGLAALAGPSYAGATRVAASSPTMWAEILCENRAALAPWLERFATGFAALSAAIAAGDRAAVLRLLEGSRRG
jgi:prephenate dehydrogenase